MPSVSPAQARLMAAVAHGWHKPGGGGPSVAVAKEFNRADAKKCKGGLSMALGGEVPGLTGYTSPEWNPGKNTPLDDSGVVDNLSEGVGAGITDNLEGLLQLITHPGPAGKALLQSLMEGPRVLSPDEASKELEKLKSPMALGAMAGSLIGMPGEGPASKLGAVVKRAPGFSDYVSRDAGVYLVTHPSVPQPLRIYRDPASGWWYEDAPGHFSGNHLGFNKQEAVDTVIKKRASVDPRSLSYGGLSRYSQRMLADFSPGEIEGNISPERPFAGGFFGENSNEYQQHLKNQKWDPLFTNRDWDLHHSWASGEGMALPQEKVTDIQKDMDELARQHLITAPPFAYRGLEDIGGKGGFIRQLNRPQSFTTDENLASIFTSQTNAPDRNAVMLRLIGEYAKLHPLPMSGQSEMLLPSSAKLKVLGHQKNKGWGDTINVGIDPKTKWSRGGLTMARQAAGKRPR